MKKNDILSVIKVGITLCLITAISALILAVVNSYTAPVIAENTLKKQEKAMIKVVPLANNFSEIEFKSKEKIVKDIYEGTNETGEVTGYAVMVSPNGYGGEISMAVGVDNELKVTGVDIISQSETAGLGAKCTKKEFKDQFIGKTENIEVSKKGAKDNEIDAISSATITSQAVTTGVNSAINSVKEIKEGK